MCQKKKKTVKNWKKSFGPMPSRVERLRELLDAGKLIQVPCCHDALSAKMVQRAGFDAVFGSGFCISASRGLPDTGLISSHEMVSSLESM